MKLTRCVYLFIACLIMGACKDDENGTKKTDRPETQAWIEDTMREHYYWYGEIPATKTLNYESDEKTFFRSLLSTKDGRIINGTQHPYSYIENKTKNTRSTIQEDYSYGIEFTGLYANDTDIYVLILYVVPGSPADEAGLTRGDWIIKINDSYITSTTTYATLSGGPAIKLTAARWIPTIGWTDKRESLQMASARAVVDDPVYASAVIQRGSKKVGYLLYNHFTPGKDDNDQTYDNKLRTVSADFKTKGVDEVVLDLRYNNGGALSSAIVLCAILAPEAKLGGRLGYLKYNDKQKSPNKYFEFTANDLNPGGKNLNLNRLYVLTSSSTASSSEMIINSLSPFMDVIVIGDQTVGKNVGSVTYPSESDPYPYGTTTWSMHPIVCQISNTNGFTDYSSGFVPGTYNSSNPGTPASAGVYVDEGFDFEIKDGKKYAVLTETLPLGSENERMLNVALRIIDGTYTRSVATVSSGGKTYTKIPGSSIDRRASNGVIIDIK